MIPEWASDGNLPPGIHDARWPEIVARFGGTPVRRQMLRGLAAAGCRRVWLDASFITDVETDVEQIADRAPGDYDACWDIRDVDLPALALRAEEFFAIRAGHAAQKRRWGGEFFSVGGPVPPGGIDQVAFFQTDRAGQPKGIVLLALDPATTGELARFPERRGDDSVLAYLLGFVVDLIVGRQRTADAKDLEIALLRHQLWLLQRRSPRPPRLSRWEKLTLAVLVARLGRVAAGAWSRLAYAVLLVLPETVLQWHRELVRRNWTIRKRATGGRLPLDAEVEALLLRLATENPCWGYGRLQGELHKLGHALGRSTIREVLKRRRLPPGPLRGRRTGTWRAFLARHRDAVLACDASPWRRCSSRRCTRCSSSRSAHAACISRAVLPTRPPVLAVYSIRHRIPALLHPDC